MKKGYVIHDQEKAHFLTATVVEWIDIFSRKSYRDVVVDSLDFCIKNKGMVLYGYVVMSNHIHLIVQSRTGELSALIRDFKKFTGRMILKKLQSEPESRREWILEHLRKAALEKKLGQQYMVWQRGNHAEEIFSEKFLWSKLDYVHLNPVRAGIVEKASHYLYSSAGNYVSGKGILDGVEKADNPIVDVLKSQAINRFDLY